MGKKTKREKQLKLVKKRLGQEQRPPKWRKPYAVSLAICGFISMLLGGSQILLTGKTNTLTGMCLLMGAVSIFFAYKVYDDGIKRTRMIEELERERNDLQNGMDE